MKTGKKIAVGLAAALAIAIFAGGAVSMVGAIPVPVLVNLVDGTDVSVTVGGGGTDFGDITKGNSLTLTDVLCLTNGGEVPAKVEARFLPPDVDGIHGLVIVGASVVPASSFTVGTTGNEVPLDDSGTDVDLGENNNVPAEGEVCYDATLTIDAQEVLQLGAHGGIIELTFSAAE